MLSNENADLKPAVSLEQILRDLSMLGGDWSPVRVPNFHGLHLPQDMLVPMCPGADCPELPPNGLVLNCPKLFNFL